MHQRRRAVARGTGVGEIYRRGPFFGALRWPVQPPAVAVVLMAGNALAANECAGLPHARPHNALGDFFVGAGAAINPEAHEQEQRGIAARAFVGASFVSVFPVSLR